MSIADAFNFNLLDSLEVDNLSTALSTQIIYKPANVVEISYQAGSNAASTGKILYVTFNALSTNDATIKLGLHGLRYPIPFGTTRIFTFSNAAILSRIDLVTDQAETGTSKVIITVGVL